MNGYSRRPLTVAGSRRGWRAVYRCRRGSAELAAPPGAASQPSSCVRAALSLTSVVVVFHVLPDAELQQISSLTGETADSTDDRRTERSWAREREREVALAPSGGVGPGQRRAPRAAHGGAFSICGARASESLSLPRARERVVVLVRDRARVSYRSVLLFLLSLSFSPDRAFSRPWLPIRHGPRALSRHLPSLLHLLLGALSYLCIAALLLCALRQCVSLRRASLSLSLFWRREGRRRRRRSRRRGADSERASERAPVAQQSRGDARSDCLSEPRYRQGGLAPPSALTRESYAALGAAPRRNSSWRGRRSRGRYHHYHNPPPPPPPPPPLAPPPALPQRLGRRRLSRLPRGERARVVFIEGAPWTGRRWSCCCCCALYSRREQKKRERESASAAAAAAAADLRALRSHARSLSRERAPASHPSFLGFDERESKSERRKKEREERERAAELYSRSGGRAGRDGRRSHRESARKDSPEGREEIGPKIGAQRCARA